MNWFYIILWSWVLLYLVEIFLLCMATRVECYMEGRWCVLKEEFSRSGSARRGAIIYGWFPPAAIAGIVVGIVVILIPVWKALIKERSFENRKS